MTQVALQVDGSGGVTVVLDIDLTREFGSSEAYHAFAQAPPAALLRAPLAERWNRLAGAIELRQPGPGPGSRALLVVTAVQPPREASAEDFASPFVWPRTRVELAGRVDRRYPLELVFTRNFRFEEPIATRLEDAAGGLRRSRWLVADQASPALPLSPLNDPVEGAGIPWQDALAYGREGFAHILPGGADHLCFVLLLFLAARTTRQLVAQVSLFTLAHSVTLILATYRIVEVPTSIVEPLIALSIIWAAMENLFSRSIGAARYGLVFGFGLLHGLGFAGALAALELPESHFLLMLLVFNLGVEAGQLVFLSLLLALFGWYRRARVYRQRVVVPLSAMSALLAGFWVVQRL